VRQTAGRVTISREREREREKRRCAFVRREMLVASALTETTSSFGFSWTGPDTDGESGFLMAFHIEAVSRFAAQFPLPSPRHFRARRRACTRYRTPCIFFTSRPRCSICINSERLRQESVCCFALLSYRSRLIDRNDLKSAYANVGGNAGSRMRGFRLPMLFDLPAIR